MKKKHIIPLAISALLAMPLTAAAAITEFVPPAGTKVTTLKGIGGENQGVRATSTANAGYDNNGTWVTINADSTSGPILVDLSRVTIKIADDGTVKSTNTSAVRTNFGSSTFKLSDIEISQNVANSSGVGLHGFLFSTNSGVFTGKIDGKNITATASTSGDVYGAKFWNSRNSIGGALNVSENVTFGNITAQSLGMADNATQANNATGFLAGTVEQNAKVTLGNVEVFGQNAAGVTLDAVSGDLKVGDIKAEAWTGTAADAGAAGLNLSGNYTGNLEAGDITVNSTTGAAGIYANNVNFNGTGKKFVVGNMDVTGTSYAGGIADAESLVFGHKDSKIGEIKVTATADGGSAVGISTASGAANYTVTENVTATATGANGYARGLAYQGGTVLLDGSKKELTVLGEATAADGSSYGIQNEDAALIINVKGDVNVLGDNTQGFANASPTPSHLGISSTDQNVLVNLNDGAELVTNSVRLGSGALTVNTAYDANAKSAKARYDLGTIFGTTAPIVVQNQDQANHNTKPKDFDANGMTTVSLDLSRSEFGPVGTPSASFGDRVTVIGYGDVSDAAQGTTPQPGKQDYEVGETIATFTYAGGDVSTSAFKSLAVFSDYRMEQVGTTNNYNLKYNGILEKLNMSDGFLAALRMHNRGAAASAVRNHMISFNGNRGYRGQECDPCAPVSECDPCEEVAMCDPCDPCGTMGSKSRRGFGLGGFTKGASTRNAWVNYIGRADSYESSYGEFNGADWKIAMDGVQVGTDLYRTNRGQFGLIFGYEGGNATNNWDRVQADDIYIGMYGARVLRGGADVRFTMSYGWQDYTMARWSSVEPPTPQTFYGSQFDGNTFEANVELGKRFHRGCWSFRPMVGLDVTSNEIDGTQEVAIQYVGNDGPMAYGDSKLTQAFARVGSDLRFQRNRFTFDSGLYLAYDMHGDSDELSATVTRVNDPKLTGNLVGSELGRTLLTFNVGGSYQLCKNLSVFGGYQGEALLGGDAGGYMSTGHVGGAWRW